MENKTKQQEHNRKLDAILEALGYESLDAAYLDLMLPKNHDNQTKITDYFSAAEIKDNL